MSWHILKDCESLPCLQGLEEVSSEAICWDGERFAPSSGPTTLGGYCLPDSETESCLDSRFGMMSKHSTEPPGEGESMSSQAGSPARTSAQPEKVQGSTASGPGCGTTWHGSFARYDRDSSSWRTAQCSLLEGLDVFSETWPRWGMMQNGECSELSTLAPRTDDIESGSSELWPTPLSGEGSGGGNAAYALAAMKGERRKSGAVRSLKLRDAVLVFPAPTYRDWKSGTGAQERPGHALPLSSAIGGQLNPPWVEWLIGWPIGWTDLRPLGMDKFRLWQQQHSEF